MKVSILTATNKNITPETIISVVNQTNKNFEWVIVNDGHFDLWQQVFPIQSKFASLSGNYGPSVARNVAFQLSDGDIITYLDSDDELAVYRVEYLLDMFEKYNFLEILFSAYSIKYPHDSKTHIFDHFNYMDMKRVNAFEYIRMLDKQNITIPMGVAHRRKPFVMAGGFQRGIVCGEDGILWRRMVELTAPHKIMFNGATDKGLAGTYNINLDGQSRTQRRFDMGGFAFHAGDKQGSHGQYLDEQWFETFNSEGLYE